MGDSPWGSYFGMFRDKYGIEWMVDFDSEWFRTLSVSSDSEIWRQFLLEVRTWFLENPETQGSQAARQEGSGEECGRVFGRISIFFRECSLGSRIPNFYYFCYCLIYLYAVY
jgi:hypothetical protein